MIHSAHRPAPRFGPGLAALCLFAAVALPGCEPAEPDTPADPPALEARRLEELEALGYAAGTNPPASEIEIAVHDAERTQPGLNLYTAGHGAEARLIDARGRLVHQWQLPFAEAFPEYERWHENAGNADRWRRVHLFPNGDLLAIYEGLGIVRIDAASRLLWKSELGAHHDLAVTEDGSVYTLTRRKRLLPRIDPDEPVFAEAISILSPDGELLRQVSLLKAFERSAFAGVLRESLQPDTQDLLHTNTIEVLDGSWEDRHPAFRRGNVLISVLYLDALAVVDMQRAEVVWLHRGSFARQHQPQLLPEGRILLFDNRGLGEHSRVVELDPFAADGDGIGWEYRGSPARPFYTKWCGSSARLANGNTLITESDDGRAFEVTRDGEIVWEFYNPHRVGADYEKIATLFELIRLPESFPTDWADDP